MFKKIFKKTSSPLPASDPLKTGLSKTRKSFAHQLFHFLSGKKQIDEALIEQIETLLIQSDLGVDVTQLFIDALTKELSRKTLKDGEAVFAHLKTMMIELLTPVERPLVISASMKPFVILVVGVNGTGKTTTIGKLAHYFQAQHHSVMLAAGDTFRAAAIEQLQIWGDRNQIPVVAQAHGSDSASVIFDAFHSAKAKKVDVLIADTAGRLHTQTHLMEELKKINRVIKKADSEAPHETLLVLDASIGQNALSQAKQFHEAIGLTGIVLTKLDGTAKGGIIFPIAQQLKLPIRFIGVGEGMDDLRPFCATDFVEALMEGVN
ncbi:MAG: signal recognition particle-docking protein FtsY [Gammaproteobacteria bacterium GWE2_42_36]|nr:MAG: signal recognition particle-docking protein FtsY [Gammaproteobacteria bacterium GWE2_42_36]HCU05705.1 signal recognition particle-docking protein FtsY [Coxiellaceae bacterium]